MKYKTILLTIITSIQLIGFSQEFKYPTKQEIHLLDSLTFELIRYKPWYDSCEEYHFKYVYVYNIPHYDSIEKSDFVDLSILGKLNLTYVEFRYISTESLEKLQKKMKKNDSTLYFLTLENYDTIISNVPNTSSNGLIVNNTNTLVAMCSIEERQIYITSESPHVYNFYHWYNKMITNNIKINFVIKDPVTNYYFSLTHENKLRIFFDKTCSSNETNYKELDINDFLDNHWEDFMNDTFPFYRFRDQEKTNR